MGLERVQASPPRRQQNASGLTEAARPVLGRGLTPGGAAALQGHAGNQATGRAIAVQRLIVAVDGDTDQRPSLRATRNCLRNLRRNKDGTRFADLGARGKVAGPAKRAKLPRNMRPLLGRDDESIYVLAHGSRYDASIGGMEPKEMAGWLRRRFRYDVGAAPEKLRTRATRPYTGKIKLISCHSGADMTHQVAGDAAKGVYSFRRSYAQQLARELAPRSRSSTFRPTSVQGIVGIGWVDERTGRTQAIDKEAYDRETASMATNSDLMAGVGTGTRENPFTEIKRRRRRGRKIREVFGDPVEAAVPTSTGAPHAGLRTGKGNWGKRRFEVGSGDEV